MTTQHIYSFLAKCRLSKGNFERRVRGWDQRKLLGFLEEAASLTKEVHDTSVPGYSFAANGSLSGEPHPCSAFSCRLRRVDQVARFAVLYSDKLVIGDPFEQVASRETYDESVVEDAIFAIALLLHLRPALELGLVTLGTRKIGICANCLVRLNRRAKRAEGAIIRQFGPNTTCELHRQENDEWALRVEGPPAWIEHGTIWYTKPIIPKSVARRAKGRSTYRMDGRDIRATGALRGVASRIVYDVLVQNIYAQKGYSYLTDRDVDLVVLNTMNDSRTQTANSAMLEGLSHSLPGLTDVPIAKLAKLRRKEGDAFAVYRDEVRHVLDQLPHEDRLSIIRVKQALNDVIVPNINRIRKTISDNRRLLWNSLRQDVIFGMGFVSIGLFSGLLSAECGAALASIGGYKFVNGVLDKANALCQDPPDARRNSFFFLWKALS